MINNRLIIAAVAAALCAGCSDEYNHRRLDADGPEAKQVVALVSALRNAGADGLDKTIARQALPGLTRDQLKSLRAAMERIVTADSVDMQKIEQFGDRVYRVVFTIETAGRAEFLAMLMGPADDDTLRWIGKN